MEQRIKDLIEKQLRILRESIADATDNLRIGSLNGVIGSLLDNDTRIAETIQLCKLIRDLEAK